MLPASAWCSLLAHCLQGPSTYPYIGRIGASSFCLVLTPGALSAGASTYPYIGRFGASSFCLVLTPGALSAEALTYPYIGRFGASTFCLVLTPGALSAGASTYPYICRPVWCFQLLLVAHSWRIVCRSTTAWNHACVSFRADV